MSDVPIKQVCVKGLLLMYEKALKPSAFICPSLFTNTVMSVTVAVYILSQKSMKIMFAPAK